MVSFRKRTAALAVCLFGLTIAAARADGPRRPVDLALSADEQTLYVPNRATGTLSVLGTDDLQLQSEALVGQRVVSVEALQGNQILAVDNQAGQLLLLKHTADEISVIQRQKVSPDPHTLVLNQKGDLAAVGSRWSRQLSLVRLTGNQNQPLRPAISIDLPFSPGSLLFVENDKTLIAADHFRGRLAIVDLPTKRLKAVRTFYAHNIRGLQIDPASGLLAVSHSMLNEYAHTVRNDVHWGVLMSNDLRWLSLPQVLDPQADFYNKGHMHPLGEPGMGGSDPGGLAFAEDGTAVVSMTGVDKVAVGKEGDFGLRRIAVGRGPTAVAVSNKHRRAFVVNTYDDTVTAIDIDKKEAIKTTSLGNSRELTLAEMGEQLFHNGRLSHDGWMTCHTCHAGGHTNGDLNDNFTDKSFGAPKQVLSLLGVADTAPYAWNGQTESLEQQIRNSHKQTMHGVKISDSQVQALAAYLRTLTPPPSVTELRGTQDDAAVTRGREIFSERQCNQCHVPPLYTSKETYDVGIHDSEGNTHFNPPSLRGVSQRGPYFHDSSAKTLEEVFTEQGHQLDGNVLSDDQLRDLTAFLRSL